jgi:hypothetical protein
MLDINIGLLTLENLEPKAQGRALLNLVWNLLPSMAPQRYGNCDPLNQKFELESLEEVLNFWQRTFFWERSCPSAEGGVWMDDKRVHSAIYISSQSKSVVSSALVQFIQESAILFGADFAYAHLFSEQEFNSGTYDMYMPFRQGVSTNKLRKYLPNLCWGNIFGSPYIKLFGREHLLAAPAPLVIELNKNAIYLQLSESIFDLKSKYLEVNTVREQVKKHLNCNAFLDPNQGESYKYRVPQFFQ